jgi:hypothetical protein
VPDTELMRAESQAPDTELTPKRRWPLAVGAAAIVLALATTIAVVYSRGDEQRSTTQADVHETAIPAVPAEPVATPNGSAGSGAPTPASAATGSASDVGSAQVGASGSSGQPAENKPSNAGRSIVPAVPHRAAEIRSKKGANKPAAATSIAIGKPDEQSLPAAPHAQSDPQCDPYDDLHGRGCSRAQPPAQ